MHSHDNHGTKKYIHGRGNYDGSKRFQDMCLIMSDNSELFSGVCNDFNNNTLLGTDNFGAYGVLCQYKNPTPPRQTHAPPGAVIFFQNYDTGRKTVPWNDGQSFADVMCYRLQEKGYYVGNFPSYTSSTRVGFQSLQIVLTMVKTTYNMPVNDIINPNWLLLDTCYTIISINN